MHINEIKCLINFNPELYLCPLLANTCPYTVHKTHPYRTPMYNVVYCIRYIYTECTCIVRVLNYTHTHTTHTCTLHTLHIHTHTPHTTHTLRTHYTTHILHRCASLHTYTIHAHAKRNMQASNTCYMDKCVHKTNHTTCTVCMSTVLYLAYTHNTIRATLHTYSTGACMLAHLQKTIPQISTYARIHTHHACTSHLPPAT